MAKYKIWLKNAQASPGTEPGLIMTRSSNNDVYIKKVGDSESNMIQIRNVNAFNINPTSSNFKNKFPAGIQSTITTYSNKSSHSPSSNISYIRGNIESGSTPFGPFVK